jgi:hypothetical protein
MGQQLPSASVNESQVGVLGKGNGPAKLSRQA